ncbi:hypothetical protein B9Z19DRAFT_435419 [Tuber borchii]|uniref:Uncharacterized protein n=1 Tax=Tuber borchii TaxID=42251 RepID=A0A2T6ZGA6_TUBBO|nr:hypothetical protein B9Z19DRAFT_435419 [Tuber borchii]
MFSQIPHFISPTKKGGACLGWVGLGRLFGVFFWVCFFGSAFFGSSFLIFFFLALRKKEKAVWRNGWERIFLIFKTFYLFIYFHPTADIRIVLLEVKSGRKKLTLL